MKTHTVSYKRHWDEQAMIAFHRSKFQALFIRLLDEGWIEGADVMEHRKNNATKSYHFQYDVFLKDIDHDVAFIFCINQKDTIRKIEIESNSRRCIFTLPVAFNEDVLYQLVREQIAGWKRGEDSEKLFLTQFLEPLVAMFPGRILSVYKTNDREDKIKGIDFVIRFLARPFFEPQELGFNLKSSRVFLRQHKSLYSTVSTFVFIPYHLEDQCSLKKRFFRFILTVAQHRVVHF